MHLAKGNYFSLSGRSPFSRLIYPMPTPGGLGVHLTLDLAGQAKFGPDVEWVDAIDYDVDPARAASFYAAIRAYWPDLPEGALQPGYAGVRPKIERPGGSATDFLLQTEKDHGLAGLINLFGIESPGLTASLAIADWVARRRLRGAEDGTRGIECGLNPAPRPLPRVTAKRPAPDLQSPRGRSAGRRHGKNAGAHTGSAEPKPPSKALRARRPAARSNLHVFIQWRREAQPVFNRRVAVNFFARTLRRGAASISGAGPSIAPCKHDVRQPHGVLLEQFAISPRRPGVMPAQAGIQQDIDRTMDSRLRGNDNTADCDSI